MKTELDEGEGMVYMRMRAKEAGPSLFCAWHEARGLER